MAQGFHWVDKECTCFAFVGDSTFFASGMTGVVNAVYNNADMILCVLDNSTTAMTGHQPHPGTGLNMMGQFVDKVSIPKVLEGIGVKKIVTVNPLDLNAAIKAVEECAALDGVKAIIFKSPCIAIEKSDKKAAISDKCIQDCSILLFYQHILLICIYFRQFSQDYRLLLLYKMNTLPHLQLQTSHHFLNPRYHPYCLHCLCLMHRPD